MRDGPHGVQVRSVARAAGLTDAGVSHHFGSRAGLLEALLNHGAAKLRAAIADRVEKWQEDEPDLVRLVESLSLVYAAGYPRLALELHAAGWRDKGAPLLEPVVEALLDAHPKAEVDQVRIALASLHQWLAFEPLFGQDFRRSVAMKEDEARLKQLNWYVEAVRRSLIVNR